MVLTLKQLKEFKPVRPTYAILGQNLADNIIPEIHSRLFNTTNTDVDYFVIDISLDEFETAINLVKKKLNGVNIAYPYQKKIIEFLDAIDSSAMDIGLVNTLKFSDGQIIGYNTDIFGFAATLEKDNMNIKEKNVLVIGYGAVSMVMAYHSLKSNANLYITGRSLGKAYKLKKELTVSIPKAKITICTRKQIPKDIQVVMNGTPLGMYPHEEKKPLYFLPKKTEYVFDAIYNPPKTSTMQLAKQNIITRNGIYMLVAQAAASQTIWNNTQFDSSVIDRTVRRALAKIAVKRLKDKHNKDNLVLCGFMGSGKTTIGKKLARLMGLKHIDTDTYLENKEGRSISDIFASDGEQVFRELETKYLSEICQMKGVVISLGGGVVLKPENVEIIKNNGYLIHLDTPFYRILRNLEGSSTRPLIDKSEKRMMEIRKLYNGRKHIYHSVPDCSVCSPRLSELLDRLLQSI